MASTSAAIDDSDSRYVIELQDFAPPGDSRCCGTTPRRRGDQRRELDWDAIYHLVMQLDLHHREKSMILVRFRRIFLYVADHYKEVECYYNKSKLFVITVGIVNPSLLSITTSHTETMYHVLFWTVWTLQLLTSLVTAYVNFNKWDKRYFLYMAFKHRIEQEIWTYLELTGRYSIVNPTCEDEVRSGKPTHRTKLHRFLLQMETIYRRLRDNDVDIESADVDSEHASSARNGSGSAAAAVASHRNDLMSHGGGPDAFDGSLSGLTSPLSPSSSRIPRHAGAMSRRGGGGDIVGSMWPSSLDETAAHDQIFDDTIAALRDRLHNLPATAATDVDALRRSLAQYERLQQQNRWQATEGRLLTQVAHDNAPRSIPCPSDGTDDNDNTDVESGVGAEDRPVAAQDSEDGDDGSGGDDDREDGDDVPDRIDEPPR